MLSTHTQREKAAPSLPPFLAAFRNVLSVCAEELPPYVACCLCRIRASEAREIYVQQSTAAGRQCGGEVERGSQREREIERGRTRVEGEVAAGGKGR